MSNKVIVFLHDGIIEGVFSSSADTQVSIVDFDRHLGEQTLDNTRWDECRAAGMQLIIPEIDHCDKEESND